MSYTFKVRILPVLITLVVGIGGSYSAVAWQTPWGYLAFLPLAAALVLPIHDCVRGFRWVVWEGESYPQCDLIEACPSRRIADRLVAKLASQGRQAFVRYSQ